MAATKKLTILSQTYAASREGKIELLMLVSDFMVNSRLRNTQWHLYGIS